MNLEKLFELVVHAGDELTKGTEYRMPTKKGFAVLNSKEQAKVVAGAIQAFFLDGVTSDGGSKIIQAFSGSSDLPQPGSDVFNVTNQVINYDILWQKAFKAVQLMKGQLQWDISNVTSGLAFKKIPEGGKVSFEGISGSTTTVPVLKYGTGLAVTFEMIEGRKLYQFVDMMEQKRAALYDLWGDIHYGLIQAAGAAGSETTWQGVATDKTVDRDIQTINLGCYTLGNNNKGKGYGDTANSPILLYASPLFKDRVLAALRTTQAVTVQGSNQGQAVNHIVEPVFTYNAALTANKGFLVLPGRKLQNSAYKKLFSVGPERDIETLSILESHWTMFGAAVGDTQQVQQIAFA